MAKAKKPAHPHSSHFDQHPAAKVAFAGVRSAITRHGKKLLAMPNVIEIRPGFKFTGGWITDQPAIVVTVLRKLSPGELKPKERIPAEIDGIPTDIAPATPAEQLRHLARRTRGAPAAPPVPEFYLPGVAHAEGPHDAWRRAWSRRQQQELPQAAEIATQGGQRHGQPDLPRKSRCRLAEVVRVH